MPQCPEHGEMPVWVSTPPPSLCRVSGGHLPGPHRCSEFSMKLGAGIPQALHTLSLSVCLNHKITVAVLAHPDVWTSP